jgi:outer membrane lipoprotein SlyB
MKNFATAFAVTVLLSSCASYRPILNDNAQYQKVGEAAAEADIDACMQKADAFLEKHKEERAMKQAGREAVGGAILGGVLGALSGRGLEGAAGGAAIGGAVGAGAGYAGQKAKDNLTPDELKQAYVQKCLQQKNYEVIGWK